MTVYAATGPSSSLPTERARQIVRATLAGLQYDANGFIVEGRLPTLFRSGGAFGIDTMFALTARELWPEVHLQFVVPRYAPYNRVLVRHLVETDELVTVLSVPPTSEKSSLSDQYMARNEVLVAPPTDQLLAFPPTRIEELRSGTWATVRRARKQLVHVSYFPLDEPLRVPPKRDEKS
jgi:hypothetical protein